MASWTSNLFSNKKEDTEKLADETSAPIKKVVAQSVSKNTKPIAVSYEKQPLAILKKLAPIRDLNDDDIAQIEQSVLSYSESSIVFTLGEKSDHVYYLLKGVIELESDGGATYFVNDDSALAHLPLNSGKICGATAITKSPCIILSITTTVIQWWVNKSKAQKGDNLEIIDIELPKQIPNNQFFNSFAQAYRENKLSLPSLPQVAMKLRKAMEKDNIGVKDVIKIVEVDAPSVAKLSACAI